MNNKKRGGWSQSLMYAEVKHHPLKLALGWVTARVLGNENLSRIITSFSINYTLLKIIIIMVTNA